MRMRLAGIIGLATTGVIGCKPSDVLSVPPPATTVGFANVHDLQTLETIYNGAKVSLFQGLEVGGGLVASGGLLTDEFTWTDFGSPGGMGLDARFASGGVLPGIGDPADYALIDLLVARSTLILAVPLLRQLEPTTSLSKVGEAFALSGYAEVFVAEDYCAGVTMSQALPGGGFVYGTALSTDSLLGMAEAHFDSALANAHGNDTVTMLASVGLGRARLDRGHFVAADSAVQGVATSFVYNETVSPSNSDNAGSVNIYTSILQYAGSSCSSFGMSDREGGNGLNFVSAHDPRLVVDSTLGTTCGGQTRGGIAPQSWYYPVKFGEISGPPITSTGLVPMATGAEARLISAEAALKGKSDIGAWAADLNALRAAAPMTYLGLASGMDPLSTDSTTMASSSLQVDVMFRERAFWLYGTGTRLGDLRRLVRQYGRTAQTVFPTGAYPNGHDTNLSPGIFSYGTDVDLTLPTSSSGYPTTNPNYKGCIGSTKTA